MSPDNNNDAHKSILVIQWPAVKITCLPLDEAERCHEYIFSTGG